MTLKLAPLFLLSLGIASGQAKTGSWTPELVLSHLSVVIDANDKRYNEKFEAGDKAVLSALAAQEKAVNAALAAAEKAVAVAQLNAEEWRRGANEWRGSMSDREITFAKQSEYILLKERLDRLEGASSGKSDLWAWIVVLISVAVSVFSVIFAIVRGRHK